MEKPAVADCSRRFWVRISQRLAERFLPGDAQMSQCLRPIFGQSNAGQATVPVPFYWHYQVTTHIVHNSNCLNPPITSGVPDISIKVLCSLHFINIAKRKASLSWLPRFKLLRPSARQKARAIHRTLCRAAVLASSCQPHRRANWYGVTTVLLSRRTRPDSMIS